MLTESHKAADALGWWLGTWSPKALSPHSETLVCPRECLTTYKLMTRSSISKINVPSAYINKLTEQLGPSFGCQKWYIPPVKYWFHFPNCQHCDRSCVHATAQFSSDGFVISWGMWGCRPFVPSPGTSSYLHVCMETVCTEFTLLCPTQDLSKLSRLLVYLGNPCLVPGPGLPWMSQPLSYHLFFVHSTSPDSPVGSVFPMFKHRRLNSS